MKSAPRGQRTLAVEVGNVSIHGFWLLVGDRERFLSFKNFPWFRDATIAQIANVELPSAHHVYWPELDIDLAVESLDHPDRYPLVSRMQHGTRERVIASSVKEARPSYKSRRKQGAGSRRHRQS